jgi:hypothetical protein
MLHALGLLCRVLHIRVYQTMLQIIMQMLQTLCHTCIAEAVTQLMHLRCDRMLYADQNGSSGRLRRSSLICG